LTAVRKSPKLYFYDVGLASALLDLRSIEHVRTHPLRGALFENMVIADLIKDAAHLGFPGQFLFYRDHRGSKWT
jgi:predicted AAA+ superfamily ATPase